MSSFCSNSNQYTFVENEGRVKGICHVLAGIKVC